MLLLLIFIESEYTMFQVVEKYQRSVKIIIGALALSFVVVGGSMVAMPTDSYLVKIGDTEITEQDVMRVAQNLEGGSTDEVKQQVLESLSNEAYLLMGAKQLGIEIPLEAIKQSIMQKPEFQENGQFSEALYQGFLKNSNQTEDDLIRSLRNQAMLMAVVNLLESNHMISDVQAKDVVGLMMSEREVRTMTFNSAMWTKDIQVSDDEVQKYYDAHKKDYMQPQAVKFEFVVLAAKALAEKQTVSEDELKKAFASQSANVQAVREVAHIMIAVPKDADHATQKALEKKAADVLAKVKAKPADFAALAKMYSDDKTSGAKGGVLGPIRADGQLGIEAAAFKLKKDEVSALVKSAEGYHIVKVLNIPAAPTMESMKPQLEAQVKEQKAVKAMRESKDVMAELAFNTPNDLKALAKKLNTTVEQSGEWITEAQAKEQQMPEELIKAIFSAESIKAKHNSEPISVEDKGIWVVRPTEVRPEKQLSFAEVKEAVQQQVFTTKLNALAKQKAQEALAKLQKGEKVDLPWSPVQTLTTEMAKQNLPPEAYQQMLSAKPVNGKPAYVLLEGLPTPVLMEVVSVKVPDNAGEILPQVKEQLATVQGQNSLVLYLQSLKKTIKMKKGSQTLRVAGSAAE